MDRIILPAEPLRLAFFGTPEIARTVLQALLDRGSDPVALVVCQPDRPKGRGQKTEPPPVKALALERGLPLIQPEKMKDGTVTARLRADRIDLAIVAAYGRILPQDLLDAPRFGCWNVHASILPRHRGASPIQHSILAGDPETGVTLMSMTAGLDEGPMLLARKTAIEPEEDAGQLAERLAVLGGETALEGLRLAREGLAVTPQDNLQATFAPRLTKEMGLLDLSRPAEDLARQVRGLNPWPSTSIGPLKVLRARAIQLAGEPGSILEAGPRLVIAAGSGALDLLSIQPPGKRPMPAADFLRGAGRDLAIGGKLQR